MLHRVGGLFVLRSALAFPDPRRFEFLEDVVQSRRLGNDRLTARLAADTSIPLALFGEIQVHDREILFLDVPPHVQFRPIEQGVDPDVRVVIGSGAEEVPQLRRLVVIVPSKAHVTR